jgi:hypothetical protein
MTATSSGQLAFLFDDALYRDSRVPAYADNTGGLKRDHHRPASRHHPSALAVNFPARPAGSMDGSTAATSPPWPEPLPRPDPSTVSNISCTGATLADIAGYGTTTAAGSLIVSGDGTHEVTCTATDGVGNSSASTKIVKIDAAVQREPRRRACS